MASVAASRPMPRWYLIPVRVLLVTFVVMLLSFAVSLLLGIGGVVLASWIKHAVCGASSSGNCGGGCPGFSQLYGGATLSPGEDVEQHRAGGLILDFLH